MRNVKKKDSGSSTAGLSFAEMVKEHLKTCDSPRKVAASMLAQYGVGLFSLLPTDWVTSVLSEAVRQHVGRQRSSAIHVEYTDRSPTTGIPTGACRMVVRDYIWSHLWMVDGVYRETRQLDVGGLLWLRDTHLKTAAEAQIHVQWFEHCIELMKKHRVTTLGGLERKGVELGESLLVDGGEV